MKLSIWNAKQKDWMNVYGSPERLDAVREYLVKCGFTVKA